MGVRVGGERRRLRAPVEVDEFVHGLGHNLTWHAQDDLLTLTYDGVEGGTYQVTFRADAPECFE